MSNFSGFTDEDLQRVKRQTSNEDVSRVQTQRGGRPAPRRKPPQRSMPSSIQDKKHTTDNLPPEQRLSHPKPKAPQKSELVIQQKEKAAEPNETSQSVSGTGTGVQSIHNDLKVKSDDTPNSGWESEMKEETEDLNEEDIVNLEMSNLDKFRVQQKAIEELNKKKRQMLANTIVQRQKKAKAETTKLCRIQAELDKMDNLLTVDVSLIRDRIEESSREYMEAQKRYARAEKEFVEAKMHMFTTQENKEQLTEHLYTVIHKNEVRKAQKLKELMQKLEMENSGEDSEITELVRHMEIPSLTVLNSLQAKSITHTSGPKSPELAKSRTSTETTAKKKKVPTATLR